MNKSKENKATKKLREIKMLSSSGNVFIDLIVVYQRILERRTRKLYFLVVLVVRVVTIVIVVILWGRIERESRFCSSTGRNDLLGSGSHCTRRFLMRRRSRRIPEMKREENQ
jgi:hypothetical protein